MAGEAKVYILDIPYHADIAYSYYIPDLISEYVTEGVIVEVPFGRGNRRMSGIVDSVSSEDPPEGVKPIMSVISDAPVLSYEQLELCRYVKSHTLCTFSDALRAMVPPLALEKIITYYRPVPEKIESGGFTQYVRTAMGERGVRVLSVVRNKSRFSMQSLQAELDFNVRPTVEMMVKYGLAEKITEVKKKASVKKKIICGLDDKIRAEIDDSPDRLDLILERLHGVNQKKILRYLYEYGKTSRADLAAELDMTTTAVKNACEALVSRSYAVMTEEEEFRNHYTLENFISTEELEKPFAKPTLTDEQRSAADEIISLCAKEKAAGVLLHGVTGSGKTNVMLEAIDYVLGQGRGVIMMVPEIALTPQTVGIFVRRYGGEIAVIHSALSSGERYDAWRRIKDGLTKVVIGTRSAVFAPLSDIGLIIIDEEHEYTYKSDTNPKYKTHDVARKRCADHHAVMILASATPSIESYYRAKTGRYRLIELKNRFGGMPLPKVDIVDMRDELQSGNLSPVSRILAERLREDKAEGNQSILFLNRRGYNNYISCRSCGKSIKCPNCSVTLTYHTIKKHFTKEEETGEEYEKSRREGGYLVCHICGYRTSVPEKCPECGKEHFLFEGCGTQKAEDDITSAFPDLRLLRMDFDTTRGKFSHEEILDKFRRGEADVLLGTQMVTKGHDFPRVATVGVLSADNSLALDDYRAGERTFAMLTQVIGRAGRGEIPGNAIIQTYNPNNEVILQAAEQDYINFYNSEIKLRKALTFPPFCDIAVINLSSTDESYLMMVTNRMMERIREHIRVDYRDVPLILFGPFEAPIYRAQNAYRMRFVIKCRLNNRSRALISDLLCEFSKSGGGSALKKLPNSKTNGRITVSADLNPSTV